MQRKERPVVGRKQTKGNSFKQQLIDRAHRLKAEAMVLPPGDMRDAKLRMVRELDITAHMDEWLTSPGLRAPQ